MHHEEGGHKVIHETTRATAPQRLNTPGRQGVPDIQYAEE